MQLLSVCCMLFLSSLGASAQNSILIKGQVVDDVTDEPLIGVSVAEKGTTNGIITDLDGNFTLNASPNSIIAISYIGYVTQEIPAKSLKGIIRLKEDTQTLDEVVVVGFGTQKKVNLTGSVATASAKDFEARPVANAVQALQGVVPGLNISNSGHGGELDAQKSINIRGNGTVGKDSNGDYYASGSPLILIDGMEGDLSTINPQDIENISVLKDAAASSIYGSRAPFGVVLVTTKSGKSGRPVINYNNSFRFNTPVKLPHMMNAWEFANYFDQARRNQNGTSWATSEQWMQNVKDYVDGKKDPNDVAEPQGNGKWNYDWAWGNVDWLHEYYRDWASAQEHNISVSGGTEKVTYYLSANYTGQSGFLRYGTEHHKRYNLTGKVSAQLTDYAKVEFSSRYARTEYTRPSVLWDTFYNNVQRRCRPNRPITDPNGYYMSDINYIEALQNGGRQSEIKDGLSQQIRLTITPLKDWNIIGELNIKNDNNWTHYEHKRVYAHMADNPENTYAATMTGPSEDKVHEDAYKSLFLNPNIYTNYNVTIANKHNIAATAGIQIEQQKYRTVSADRADMVSLNLPVLNLATSSKSFGIGGVLQEWASVGFFGRVNYDYDGRYLVEGNLRYDGSSRFRRGNRWVLTPSFSLGWNIAREAFWESLVDKISSLKLRVSYGTLANANTISWYPTYQVIDVKPSNGNWLINDMKPTTATAPGLVSYSLTWEKVKNMNVGLDVAALNNRLTGSFDYFIRKTSDMMGPGIALPATLGTDVPAANNTDMKTYGWELQLGWRDQIKDFKYGVKLSLSDAQSKILRYGNPTGDLGKYIEGELIGNIYGYTTVGIAKTDEEMQAHLAKNNQDKLGDRWAAGDIMYKDLNGDGKVDNGSNTIYDMGDMKKIGNDTPRFMTGINLDASYKGWDIQMFWQGVLKRDWWPGYRNMTFWGVTNDEWWSTSMKEHLDYFRTSDNVLGENLDAYYPRPVFGDKNHRTQTRYLQNAAYMRLKNLQIGYTFPKVWLKKIMLQNLRIFISGENLLTITGLSDTMDPETCGAGYQSNEQANGTVYPLSRTISFGLSVNL